MGKTADKRIFFTFLVSLVISGFIVISSIEKSVHAQRQYAETASAEETVTEPLVITVKEYEGKIGAFRGNSPVPFKIIDYDVSLLSEFDRSQLKSGIIMQSEEQLRQFTEDIST